MAKEEKPGKYKSKEESKKASLEKPTSKKEEKSKEKAGSKDVSREEFYSTKSPDVPESDIPVVARIETGDNEEDNGGGPWDPNDGGGLEDIVLVGGPTEEEEVILGDPVNIGGHGEVIDVCNPPCTADQQYYVDETSTTGWRRCSDCTEVSPINPYGHLNCDDLFQLVITFNQELETLESQLEAIATDEQLASASQLVARSVQISTQQSVTSNAPQALPQSVANITAQISYVEAHLWWLAQEIQRDGCNDNEEHCAPDHAKPYCSSSGPFYVEYSNGLYYPDDQSPTGFSLCEDCSEYEPTDDDGCKPPCIEGQVYYLDPTSSTGYRKCDDCSEIGLVEDPGGGIDIHGEVIEINTIEGDTVFSGTIYQPQTLTYNEQVKGWTSFKTFYPENALSINNHYYTYSGGEMWQHHLNPRRNNFYGVDANSTVDLIFNDAPSSVKGFQTIKYEGTQSRILQFTTVNKGGIEYTDKEFYNLTGKPGWYVSYIETDLQTGKVPEFINKEGKWFNSIKGDCTQLENVDEREFSVQGIGFGGLTHSDPDSEAPRPVEITIQIKDSSADIDGTEWD